MTAKVRQTENDFEGGFSLDGIGSANFTQTEHAVEGNVNLPGIMTAKVRQTENEFEGGFSLDGIGSANFTQTEHAVEGKANLSGIMTAKVRQTENEFEGGFGLDGIGSANFTQTEYAVEGKANLSGIMTAKVRQTENEFEGGFRLDGIGSANFTQTEHAVEGKVNLMGAVVCGERKSYDASGSQETSKFEYDASGKLKHYYGETEETTGTVEASYFGGGIGTTPGPLEASAQVKVNVCNDQNVTTRKQTQVFSQAEDVQKEKHTTTETEDHSSVGTFLIKNDVKTCTHQHATDVMDNKVIESKITTNTQDTSQSVCGWKYKGKEVTTRHTETTTTNTEQGFFTNKVTSEKVTEDVEYTQRHSWLDSEINITKDASQVETQLEYALNEAGCGALVMLVKPAVKLHKEYMDTGTLAPAKVFEVPALDHLVVKCGLRFDKLG